jgi:hypothetical protein
MNGTATGPEAETPAQWSTESSDPAMAGLLRNLTTSPLGTDDERDQELLEIWTSSRP